MLRSLLITCLLNTVGNPQKVVGIRDHVAVLEERVINDLDQLFESGQGEASETIQQIVRSIIDHVFNVFLDMHPLLQRFTVPLTVVKAVAALQLEPDRLVIVHVDIVPAIRNENVHCFESILKVASFEHLHG